MLQVVVGLFEGCQQSDFAQRDVIREVGVGSLEFIVILFVGALLYLTQRLSEQLIVALQLLIEFGVLLIDKIVG